MDSATLQIFTRQLASWTEAAIAEGRFPFRKVEVFPELLTDLGVRRPALVFWVNRASCMAGGVLLLPDREAEEAVVDGRTCAAALGLRHFVTWAAREVVFWEEQGEAALRCRTVPLPAEGSAAEFRQTLTTVLDELKLLAVTGAVPPDRLSAHYLANLCHGTLQNLLPPLEEICRMIPDGIDRYDLPPEELARHKGVLTLLRLLGLAALDALPPTVRPEGLERAMRFALDTLPAGPRSALAIPDGEPPLPSDEAVACHHLFRRLTQLRSCCSRERMIELLEILLQQEAPHFGGRPLPRPDRVEASAGATLLINPDHVLDAGPQALEVAAAPILAFTALLRHMRGLAPPQEQATAPFLLSSEAAPYTVHGTLCAPEVPPAARRQGLAAQLRTSWPARRFPLPPRTPLWTWEFLHLLGLAVEGARIEVATPEDWLTADYGSPLAALFGELFTLERLARDDAGLLQLSLRKSSDQHATTEVIGPAGARQVPWSRVAEGHRVLLPLALHLPDELFQLLDEGCLQLAPPGDDWPDTGDRELYLFSRSSLGRLLWTVVSGGRPLPQRKVLRDEFRRRDMPRPADEILENLRLLPWDDGQDLPPQAVIDSELALWLGSGITLAGRPQTPAKRRATPRQPDTEAAKDLAGEIAAEVFVDGFPRFPEQYLYDHYRPQLVQYAFDGPLSAGDEFFGRFTLHDRQGRALEVEGAETARALLLASFGDRQGASLPCDRNLTASILDRYLVDLQTLRRNLLQQTRMRLPDPRAADTLADTIWNDTPLPPWEMVEA